MEKPFACMFVVIPLIQMFTAWLLVLPKVLPQRYLGVYGPRRHQERMRSFCYCILLLLLLCA